MGDAAPGDKHRKRSEQPRQEDQEQAQTIDAQVVIDGRQHHPDAEFFKLHPRAVGVKLEIEPDGHQESEQGTQQCDPANGRGPVASEESDDDGAQQREERHDRQGVLSEPGHRMYLCMLRWHHQ